MVIYSLCFKPSKNNPTNYMNASIHSIMVIYEIVLFIYNTSTKSAAYQNTISYTLFGMIGIAVITVIIWIFYRLVLFIR